VCIRNALFTSELMKDWCSMKDMQDHNAEEWKVGEVVMQIAQEVGIPPMQDIVFCN
jgi:hypothetical protein